MKNLGRIVLFLLSLTTLTFADVTARVMPDIVYAGDMATYSLSISGENIQKPVLNDICGNDIVSTGSSTSIVMVNGDYKKSYTLTYNFVPQKSCVIEPVSVVINSQTEHSNAVALKVKPVAQDLSADFLLTLESSQKSLYVGEPFEVTFTLKQKRDAQVVDSKFVAPDFKGFWMKSQSKPVTINDGAYIVTKLTYRLAAQREGNATIKPAQIKIATRARGANGWGSFMQQVRWKTYYSNALDIEAKALPAGVKLIGDFHISAVPQKLEINANEALNVTLKVEGEGNLEDIESFKPYVENVNVFDEKIEIHGDTLTQKLAFVSDADFTIPSFQLKYFSTKTGKVESIETQEIAIKVHGSGAKSKLEIQRGDEKVVPKQQSKHIQLVRSVDKVWLLVAFLIGLVTGVILMLLRALFGEKSVKKQIDLKDEKGLFMKLLPFKERDAEVEGIVNILEKNIYSETKEKIDKKLLKEILKRYNIS